MILFSVQVVQDIERAAKLAYPAECCGLLEGCHSGPLISITQCHPSRNVAAMPEQAFEIDPALHIKLQRALRNKPTSIVGVYHSHPNGDASPSQSDLDCSGDEELVWLITSLSNGTILQTAGFRLQVSKYARWFEPHSIQQSL